MKREPALLLALLTLINLTYNAFLPLHPDEAYYWVWAQNLQLSYFDHPPMIAYVIKLFTLFQHNEWTIRLTAVFCLTISSVLVYRLASRLFSERAAFYALLVYQFMPISQIGYQMVTPDAPLALFWTTTLYAAYKAIFERQKSYFLLAGLSAGLLLLSKYTGILLLAAIFLFLVTGRYRHLLMEKHVYAAIFLTLIIFSPVLVWNWQNDWVSFRFQFSHGIAEEKVFSPITLARFLVGEAGVVNPFFFFAFLYYTLANLRRNLSQEKLSFLTWPFLIMLLFFTYTAMFKKAELNWPAPAYISGSILLGYWLAERKNKWVPTAGCILTIILLILVRVPEFFPFLPNTAVLKSQYYGYNELFRNASRSIDPSREVVLSDSYQNASMAWYYLEGNPHVYILTSTRISNYDYWESRLAGKPLPRAVYVGPPDKLAQLQQLFERVEEVDRLHYQSDRVNRTFAVYRCYNYKDPSKLGMLPLR